MGGEAATALKPGPAGSPDSCGQWIQHVELQGKTLIGWIHNETACNYARGGQSMVGDGPVPPLLARPQNWLVSQFKYLQGWPKFDRLWETVSMARKRTKLERSQRQSDRSEKRLNGTRREAAKRKAREDVNQAVERIVRK
jgi:hypothetical protein